MSAGTDTSIQSWKEGLEEGQFHLLMDKDKLFLILICVTVSSALSASIKLCYSCPTASPTNGKISIFVLLSIRGCHQTMCLCSMPGHHMGSQHAVFPADRWPHSALYRGQRARSCLFYVFASVLVDTEEEEGQLLASVQHDGILHRLLYCATALLRSRHAITSERQQSQHVVLHIHMSTSGLQYLFAAVLLTIA